MSTPLPERASLEYLKKLAKDRLAELRRSDPKAKLAAALLAVARDHGFSSWRALKAEVELRRVSALSSFMEACIAGDADSLRAMLAVNRDFAREAVDTPFPGWTGLHHAAKTGHVDAVRVLLEHGADPNAREQGDNTYPLHWAVAAKQVEISRALLDAGGDVHGFGDLHELDAIGWATVFPEQGDEDAKRAATALLMERGARHHIFSALATGDLGLVRTLVEQNPEMLDRRGSRFENRRTALHYAIEKKQYDAVELLIELGADIEAADSSGRTAMAVAMLRGDTEGMKRLDAAGAKRPESGDASGFLEKMGELARSVARCEAMIRVPDVGKTLDWFRSIGFEEKGRFADGPVVWGSVGFGKGTLTITIGELTEGTRDVSLWFMNDSVEELYQTLKSKQLAAAEAALAGVETEGIVFDEDLYEPFYGGRQFSIRDPNGYSLIFYQPR